MGIGISGINSGMDTDAIVEALVMEKTEKKNSLVKAQKKLEWKQDAWKALNTKIYSFYTKTLSSMRMIGSYNKKKTTISSPNIASVSASGSSVNGTQSLGVEQLAKAGSLTGGKIATQDGGKVTKATTMSELGITSDSTIKINVAGEDKTFTIGKDDTVQDVLNKLSEAGVKANFDENHGRFFVNAKESGKTKDFNFDGNSGDALKALQSLGLAEDASKDTDHNPVKMAGENAVIYLNGARFESENNTVTVNGLTITAQEVTGKDSNGNLNTVSITTAADTEGVYNMIKDFFKGYNELINEMDKLYGADSSRGYEPLLDEEKEAMTDGDIEKWETKIKDSLLRRDSTLSSVIQVMKSAMSGGAIASDGSKHFLSEFGIATAGYSYASKFERGAYHIAGDQDDTFGMDKVDKLMAALTEDPEHVAEVMSGICTNLYDGLTKAMRSTGSSSAFTVYNDKQMKEEYDSYTKKISAQEEKVRWWEDYYRSKFTAMEKMLASLNSQQSSLSGLIGG